MFKIVDESCVQNLLGADSSKDAGIMLTLMLNGYMVSDSDLRKLPMGSSGLGYEDNCFINFLRMNLNKIRFSPFPDKFYTECLIYNPDEKMFKLKVDNKIISELNDILLYLKCLRKNDDLISNYIDAFIPLCISPVVVQYKTIEDTVRLAVYGFILKGIASGKFSLPVKNIDLLEDLYKSGNLDKYTLYDTETFSVVSPDSIVSYFK